MTRGMWICYTGKGSLNELCPRLYVQCCPSLSDSVRLAYTVLIFFVVFFSSIAFRFSCNFLTYTMGTQQLTIDVSPILVLRFYLYL